VKWDPASRLVSFLFARIIAILLMYPASGQAFGYETYLSLKERRNESLHWVAKEYV
jgi:hypothetical protein